MTTQIPDTKALIRRLGGPTKVGRHLDISHSAVIQWDLIPTDHVPALVQLSLANGDPVGASEMRPDKPWSSICEVPAP